MMYGMLTKNGLPVQTLSFEDEHEFTWQEIGVKLSRYNMCKCAHLKGNEK